MIRYHYTMLPCCIPTWNASSAIVSIQLLGAAVTGSYMAHHPSQNGAYSISETANLGILYGIGFSTLANMLVKKWGYDQLSCGYNGDGWVLKHTVVDI
jgi:hypothetical protein